MANLIVHVDMDAFFAAIEERDDPTLRDKPVVIGADPKNGQGRGVVSTCNYVARKYGIHSAMPISQAYRLCPHAVFVPPHGRKYYAVSKIIMEILRSFSPAVEQVSVDEAFMDCTGTELLFGSPEELGKKIKQAIKEKTNLTASVGMAVNKSIAKIASDLDKPDGLIIVPPDKEKEFLAPLDIGKIWGIGKKSQIQLHQLGIYQVGQLAAWEKSRLKKRFGKYGIHLWNMANGIDPRRVINSEYEGDGRKSISEERTFAQDIDNVETAKMLLFKLADDISTRMRKEKIVGKTISIKVRLTGFETHTRNLTINDYIQDPESISALAIDLFNQFYHGQKKIRLLGVSVSNLIEEHIREKGLFEAEQEKKQKIYQVIDQIKKKHGKKSLNRAVYLNKKKSPD
ncbi:MAG: DNA polymerase IV [Spirochaetes bacterium]|nr:DNA polymerase IV [Spirochaetota bacterium]